MPSKIFTLYLSTQTPAGSIYAPFGDTSNKAIMSWNINWEQLYGSIGAIDERITRVKFQLSSLAQNAVYTWAANSGVLAIQGLGNKFSNSANGLVLGAITPSDSPVAVATASILYGETLQTSGVQAFLPYGYAPITVLILDRAGALQTNVLDYQLILQFEMDDA